MSSLTTQEAGEGKGPEKPEPIFGPPEREGRKVPNRSFTLVEMLVVIAVIALLAAILMPALQTSLRMSKSTHCLNNLRGLGIGHAGYQNDWNGHVVASYGDPITLKQWWNLLGPYVGLSTSLASTQPKNNRGNIYCCPELQVTSATQYPHYVANGYLGTPFGGYATKSLKISQFKTPSRKIFLADGRCSVPLFSDRVAPVGTSTTATVGMWHVGDTANIVFMDGSCRTLGAPPIPPVPPASAEGEKWLVYNKPPPNF